MGTMSKWARPDPSTLDRPKSSVRVIKADPKTGEIIEKTVSAQSLRPKRPEYIPQRAKQEILAGERPAIKWPGDKDCPVVVGQVVALGTRVQITITGIRRNRRGEHVADYRLRDDRPVLMRRTPKMFEAPEVDGLGFPIEPTKEAINAATIDGNYTQDPSRAVSDGGEVPDVEYRTALGLKSRMGAAQAKEKAEERAREDARRFAAQIRDILIMHARSGVDSTPFLADLQRLAHAQTDGEPEVV